MSYVLPVAYLPSRGIGRGSRLRDCIWRIEPTCYGCTPAVPSYHKEKWVRTRTDIVYTYVIISRHARGFYIADRY